MKKSVGLLKAVHHRPQLGLHLLGYLLQLRVSHGCHGRCGVHRCDLHLPFGHLLYDDVARQHDADLVLGLQGPVSERRIAGAQDLGGELCQAITS